MLCMSIASPRLFRALTPKEIEAAKVSLSRPWQHNPSSKFIRVFDLDAAKVLLLLSAVMYEPNSLEFRTALRTLEGAHQFSNKKAHRSAASDLRDALRSHGAVIPAFCKHLGIESAMVSQLNRFSTAGASVFWDRNSNWIVVAFRGTSSNQPIPHIRSAKINQVDARPWLEGSGKVHSGFKNRIFPEVNDYKLYESVASAVRELSQHLLEGKTDEMEVNVWFTGHSLGCAVASLAYSRAILKPEEFGKSVRIRDAYLFAAPMVCDVSSVESFNEAIRSTEDHGRTMWRVTNARDAVATALPTFGDRKGLHLSPTNILAFAHLGIEIKMRDSLTASILTLHPRVQVKIASTFTDRELDDLRKKMRSKGAGLSFYERAALNVPFVGRLLAHGSIFYWDQLSRLGTGQRS